MNVTKLLSEIYTDIKSKKSHSKPPVKRYLITILALFSHERHLPNKLIVTKYIHLSFLSQNVAFYCFVEEYKEYNSLLSERI